MRLFVVSPFGKQDTELWQRAKMILEEFIRPAAEQAQFEVVRADEISTERITSALIWELDNDPMVVAYLGPDNSFSPNVLFEIGYRAGKHKPMLIIKHTDTVLPFDLADYQMVELPPIVTLLQRDLQNPDRDDTYREQIKAQLVARSYRHVKSAYAIAEIAFDMSDNAPPNHVFTAASEEANRIFHMGEGESLIGRNPMDVEKSLKSRVPKRQWKKFNDEQEGLVGRIVTKQARNARATVPFIFNRSDDVDEAFRGRAFLAIVVDSVHAEDSLRLWVLYLECTNQCKWDEEENCFVCELEGVEEVIIRLAHQLNPSRPGVASA